MNCSDRERAISDYLDDALNARQKKELEDHLQTCRACREVLQRLKKAGRLVREAVNFPAPAAENWDARRDRIKRNIIAEITPAHDPGPGRWDPAAGGHRGDLAAGSAAAARKRAEEDPGLVRVRRGTGGPLLPGGGDGGERLQLIPGHPGEFRPAG